MIPYGNYALQTKIQDEILKKNYQQPGNKLGINNKAETVSMELGNQVQNTG